MPARTMSKSSCARRSSASSLSRYWCCCICCRRAAAISAAESPAVAATAAAAASAARSSWRHLSSLDATSARHALCALWYAKCSRTRRDRFSSMTLDVNVFAVRTGTKQCARTREGGPANEAAAAANEVVSSWAEGDAVPELKTAVQSDRGP
eukprot:365034-Chlamydomonas_euryale.AAC.11